MRHSQSIFSASCKDGRKKFFFASSCLPSREFRALSNALSFSRAGRGAFVRVCVSFFLLFFSSLCVKVYDGKNGEGKTFSRKFFHQTFALSSELWTCWGRVAIYQKKCGGRMKDWTGCCRSFFNSRLIVWKAFIFNYRACDRFRENKVVNCQITD